ncbi:hypothetical protein [Dysgonomonas massiliensis]|uniref:hypothetical protein n=1 Tax=Dysgonomonas massiliensis TaxID=2040292 RepID=UPI000C791D46|nr:hypothetical protein [Dysgonomonas massiliensis]
MNSNNKSQIIGIGLTILMLLSLLNSGYFFLVAVQLNVSQWLAFNACSLTMIVYLVCFTIYLVRKESLWLSIPLLPMYYYGTMGLFLMPWNEVNIFAHATHVIITITILWTLYTLLKKLEFEILGKGLLVSMIVFVPIIAVIQTYNQANFEEFMQLLQNMQ